MIFLTILATGAIINRRSSTPLVRLDWSVATAGVGRIELSEDGSTVLAYGVNSFHKYLTSNGTEIKVNPPGTSSTPIHALVPGSKSIGKGDFVSQALVDCPRAKIGCKDNVLIEYAPNTDDPIAFLDLDKLKGLGSTISMTRDPVNDSLLISSFVESGRTIISDHLFLSPLHETSLRFFEFEDISQPKFVLGHPLPPNVTKVQLVNGPVSPDTGLACGNALTGKILWRNDLCEWGRWVGNYVLAQRRDDLEWVLLRPQDGKIVMQGLPDLSYQQVSFRIYVGAFGNSYYVLNLSTSISSRSKISKYTITS